MNYRKAFGTGIALMIILSGCASDKGSASNGGQTASAASSPQANAQNGQGGRNGGPGQDGMNRQSLKMNFTFRSLLTMDKSDGLAITKEQADYMLPLVQAAITKADLTDEDEKKLLEKLTDKQKAYIQDASSRVPNGGGQQGGGRPEGRGGGPDRGSASGSSGAPGGSDASGNAGSATGGTQGRAGATDGGSAPGQGRGGAQGQGQGRGGGQGAPGAQGSDAPDGGTINDGMNIATIGQQLVEMLQSKIKT
ncbi:hypothetical protein ACFFNY_14315 [Paenibacillus hodogayensis]|uniref:Lipoprotein n=1 Tax=Paenibacillus hodogayensis TaxID=279208 RepID=A0ABV5VXN4_9BACL